LHASKTLHPMALNPLVEQVSVIVEGMHPLVRLLYLHLSIAIEQTAELADVASAHKTLIFTSYRTHS